MEPAAAIGKAAIKERRRKMFSWKRMGKEDAEYFGFVSRPRVKDIQIYQAAAFCCFGLRVGLPLKVGLTGDFFISARVRVDVECCGGEAGLSTRCKDAGYDSQGDIELQLSCDSDLYLGRDPKAVFVGDDHYDDVATITSTCGRWWR
jgi:hypothetical protein